MGIVPLSLPGADVEVSKLSVGEGCWRAILRVITRPIPKYVDIGGHCKGSSEVT